MMFLLRSRSATSAASSGRRRRRVRGPRGGRLRRLPRQGPLGRRETRDDRPEPGGDEAASLHGLPPSSPSTGEPRRDNDTGDCTSPHVTIHPPIKPVGVTNCKDPWPLEKPCWIHVRSLPSSTRVPGPADPDHHRHHPRQLVRDLGPAGLADDAASVRPVRRCSPTSAGRRSWSSRSSRRLFLACCSRSSSSGGPSTTSRCSTTRRVREPGTRSSTASESHCPSGPMPAGLRGASVRHARRQRRGRRQGLPRSRSSTRTPPTSSSTVKWCDQSGGIADCPGTARRRQRTAGTRR